MKKTFKTFILLAFIIFISNPAHAFSLSDLREQAANLKNNLDTVQIQENLEKVKPLAQKSGSIVATIHGKQQQKKHNYNLEGTVIRVLDGDTIDIRFNNPPQGIQNIERIRLAEIDAPESNQNWGRESTQALHSQINNQTVTISFDEKDQYGRIIGTIFKDNININYWMVKEGHAWQYKRFSNSRILARLENSAKSNQIGLWSQPNPTEPWNFR